MTELKQRAVATITLSEAEVEKTYAYYSTPGPWGVNRGTMALCESHEKLRMDLRESWAIANKLAVAILEAVASIEGVLSEETHRGREILGHLSRLADTLASQAKTSNNHRPTQKDETHP